MGILIAIAVIISAFLLYFVCALSSKISRAEEQRRYTWLKK